MEEQDPDPDLYKNDGSESERPEILRILRILIHNTAFLNTFRESV